MDWTTLRILHDYDPGLRAADLAGDPEFVERKLAEHNAAPRMYAALRPQLPATRPDATGGWAGVWQFEPKVPARFRSPVPIRFTVPNYTHLGLADLAPAEAESWRSEIAARQAFLAAHGLLADEARDWPTDRPSWWYAP